MPITICRGPAPASIIRVTGVGVYSVAETVAHFRELSSLVAATRECGRVVRALIDLRHANTQPQDVAGRIELKTKAIFDGPDDRVAIVVASSLLTMQLRRIHTNQNFLICDVAETADRFLLMDPDTIGAAAPARLC